MQKKMLDNYWQKRMGDWPTLPLSWLVEHRQNEYCMKKGGRTGVLSSVPWLSEISLLPTSMLGTSQLRFSPSYHWPSAKLLSSDSSWDKLYFSKCFSIKGKAWYGLPTKQNSHALTVIRCFDAWSFFQKEHSEHSSIIWCMTYPGTQT